MGFSHFVHCFVADTIFFNDIYTHVSYEKYGVVPHIALKCENPVKLSWFLSLCYNSH